MNKDILFITPPFTQLSSPYAANPFLKGYLNDCSIFSTQIDLSIEIFLKIFSKNGLEKIFNEAKTKLGKIIENENIFEIYENKNLYIDNIEEIIKFLQNKNNQFAYFIINNIPPSKRAKQLEEAGILKNFKKSINEYATLLATFFIDDLSDFISFLYRGFKLSSYKEYVVGSGINFQEIEKEILKEDLISDFLKEKLKEIDFSQYKLVSITVPFPGTLIMAFKIANYIKKNYSKQKIIMGGGYINTDLRNIKNKRVFEYVDFISLDYGERILEKLIKSDFSEIKNSFFLKNGEICFEKDFEKREEKLSIKNNDLEKNNFLSEKQVKKDKFTDIKEINEKFQCIVDDIVNAKPDYSDLDLSKYITLKETTNKMHNLWSERLFLKHRMAIGCYHHRCNFCDTELDYIKIYKPSNVEKLILSIKDIINKTGISSFHFVDEAMPPALIKEFCIKLIQEKIKIVWWGNIRFDKAFNYELTRLMSKAGCIAVTGGIESLNEKILLKINKKIELEEIIKVLYNFSSNNILVHSYMIYGFPEETLEDIVYSLEILRQLYKNRLITSSFYHRFALTKYSPFYKEALKYGIRLKENRESDFSNSEINYETKIPFQTYEKISQNIEKAIFNFNYGLCLDNDILFWFENISNSEKNIINQNISRIKNYVLNIIKKYKEDLEAFSDKYFNNKKIYWLGDSIEKYENYIFLRGFKNSTYNFDSNCQNTTYATNESEKNSDMGAFFKDLIEKISKTPLSFEEFKILISEKINFDDFLKNELFMDLKDCGLFFL